MRADLLEAPERLFLELQHVGALHRGTVFVLFAVGVEIVIDVVFRGHVRGRLRHILFGRDGVLAANLRDRYDNATGYTLGYYAPWSPRTSDFTRLFIPTATWALEPGMVFHMYVSARGLAFSETVLVTDAGAERLTQTERALFVR